jgi:hypothetical protein
VGSETYLGSERKAQNIEGSFHCRTLGSERKEMLKALEQAEANADRCGTYLSDEDMEAQSQGMKYFKIRLFLFVRICPAWISGHAE